MQPSQSFPVAQRLTSGGIPVYSELVWQASDTGLYYSVTVTGTPPAFTFSPTPDVAEIRSDFTTVAQLRTTVPTVSQLRTWGI